MRGFRAAAPATAAPHREAGDEERGKDHRVMRRPDHLGNLFYVRSPSRRATIVLAWAKAARSPLSRWRELAPITTA
jgi:hypothetical protein